MGLNQIPHLLFTDTINSAEARYSTPQLGQNSEHGKLLQVHLVNQRINEVENDKPRLISLEHYDDLNQVFENKDEKKKK